MAVEKFVVKTLSLLEKERDCEIDETRALHESLPPKELQRRGVCLLKLRLAEKRTGLYGRSLLTFEPQIQGQELPSHNLTPGDIVSLSLSSSDKGEIIASGIVSRVWQAAVCVAFDESIDTFSLSDEEKYKLLKLANNVTYKRLKRALGELNTYSSGPASHLISVLFQVSERSTPAQHTELTFNNEALDDSQKEAVRFALHQKDVAVIHGPPGTGKTTTVVEIIIQAVRQGLKVLACASSNVAVDNLVERLANQRQRLVRLGHPARLLTHLQRYSLDAILSSSDQTKIVEDVRRDVDKTLLSLKKSRDKGEKRGLKDELKLLRRELREREAAATRDILKQADIVLVTLSSATDDGPLKYLTEQHFDLTVIDECSQALEAACWMALLRSPRCVLAGDHHQLPPTILSHEAAREGLELTLMERVLAMYGDEVMRMLTVQYRMHQDIMEWSSNQLYGGQLTAHSSVRTHLLRDLPGVTSTDDTDTPLLLIDTAGCDLQELDLPEEISKGNEGEADVVTGHVEQLVSCGVKPENIAVIAPYNLQVELLRIRLSSKYPTLEIKSVDGFQGREKEAVVISMVRSNVRGEVGFLADKRRINVAITRARRHLAVVCDTETVGMDDFLRSLTDFLSERGEVRSADEFHTGLSSADTPDHVTELIKARSVQKPKLAKGGNSSVTVKHTGWKTERAHQKSSGGDRKVHETESKPETPIEEDPRYGELELVIREFTSDKSQEEHHFPATFTPRDRFIVHEIAEKFGLSHSSLGEGTERHISIKKPTPSEKLDFNKPSPKGGSGVTRARDSLAEAATVLAETTSVSNFEQTDAALSGETANSAQPGAISKHCNSSASVIISEQLNGSSTASVTQPVTVAVAATSRGSLKTCQHCGKDVITANLQLHELHCLRAVSKPSSKKAECRPVSAAKTKTKAPKSAIDKVDADDFNGLLAAATKQNSRCAFHKCKEVTVTLGQTCEFCGQRFCLGHHMAEVHGCGDQAKAKARQVITREGILYRGSGFKQTLPDPAKKAQLQRKLDKKLDEMSEKRRVKKTSKK